MKEMKKKYVIPEIEVVKMETEGVMMAESFKPEIEEGPGGGMGEGDEGSVLSKPHNFNLWED